MTMVDFISEGVRLKMIEFESYRWFSNMDETHRFTKGCL